MTISLSGKNLIFIISQPRSGSTLLQRILAGNPQVHTTPEPWLMLHPIYSLRIDGYKAEYNEQLAHTALIDFLSSIQDGEKKHLEAIAKMASYLYNLSCEEAGKTYFVDKTPRYYLIISELSKIFPDAKFIFLFRNPLSVLASILNTLVKEHWLLLARYKHDLITAPDLLLNSLSVMDDGQSIKVNYEELVSQPDIQVRRLCEHIGLDYQDEMINYGRKKFTLGHMGDTTNINKYSSPTTENIDRWLKICEHRQPRHFVEEYLNFLGPIRLSKMGYDYENIRIQLKKIPVKGGEVTISWDQIFTPNEALKKRLIFTELALLEHRRMVYTIKEFIKKSKRLLTK
jgi:hypothetical protein